MNQSKYSDIRIAVISDIHGNSTALQKVLKDINTRGIEHVVNLGDSLYGPLDPPGTADILIENNILSISGNEDRILIEDSGAIHNSPSLQFTKDQLKDHHIEWLKSLTKTKTVFDDFILFHGTPTSDSEYLLHKVFNGRLALRNGEEIKDKLRNVEEKIILCGHDHTPNIITLDDGRLIINPGSVGCPAYYDDSEPAHKVETGNPFAKYALLSRINSVWKVENVALTYDWNSAAEKAMANGREDWVNPLKYGRV